MRFLILSQYYPPEVGAAQVRLHNMARALQAQGHQVEVVTALPNYPRGEVFAEYRGRGPVTETLDGIPIARSWIYPVQRAGLSRLLSYASFQLSSWRLLCETARRFRPDFVFVESPPLFLGLSALALKRRLGVPFILNVADLWPDFAVELGVISEKSLYCKLARRLEAWLYRESHRITVPVHHFAQTLRDKGVPGHKLLFLPNGVDLRLFSPERRPLQSAAAQAIAERCGQRRIVLYAGTHGKAHALEMALDAAELLKARKDLIFLFVGDGSEKARLVAEAQARGLSHVLFHEPVPPEVVAELQNVASIALSTVGAIATRAAKVFPAMASGRALVYAGRGEGAELVRDAEAGLVVPPFEPEALAGAIATLLDDPALAERLGRNGRRYVEAHLGWEHVVGHWLGQLADGPADPPAARLGA